MKEKNNFLKAVYTLAIPVTLQSMLQSSFSIVDQIMIGQLGSVNVSGVGLAGKFSSIYTVVISAIGAVAGIMISQYLGQKNKKEVRRSFFINLLLGCGIAALFAIVCFLFPWEIMDLYTNDSEVTLVASSYLSIIAGSFIPLAGATMLSTLLRCDTKAHLPLFASIVSAALNTILNYIFIFGKCGCPVLGIKGAALATVISQIVNFIIMLIMILKWNSSLKAKHDALLANVVFNWKQYIYMLLPLLVCEVVWSLGENVYAIIYGHIGTKANAAMTLTHPIQGLLIGALCGLSQAASVLIGKKLGNAEYEDAYYSSKKLIKYGAIAASILSIIVIITSSLYVEIYHVENEVKILTTQILFAYALVAPFKVLNMILGGGIIRSGGKTKYVMFIDIIGTWGFGVPLGFISAFVLNLSIPYVYFILSLEECIRFAISLIVFRRKNWMKQLQATAK